jgi:hypothetical protein
MNKDLNELIREYGRLQNLDGYTPQSRGQRLNGLIAEMLLYSGVNAKASVRSHGEIDVSFGFDGRHFIVEAKWETKLTDTGSLAKLQKRLRQRLGGTIGIFISMAGYTDEALRDLKDGEQLMVICLTRTHVEAMLSGFIPPLELISKVVEKASQQGISFTEISNLFDRPYISEMKPDFGHLSEINQLVIECIPGFEAYTIISSLPFGQSGIAEITPSKLLITSNEGIFLVDTEKRKVSPRLLIPNCSRNPLVHSDGSVFVIRNGGIARMTGEKIEFVAGGLEGNICLSLGRNGSVWAFSNGTLGALFGDKNGVSPRAVLITDRLGFQTEWSVNYPASTAHVAASVDDETMLVCGNSGIALVSALKKDELVSAKDNPLTNPGCLTRLTDDKFLIACNNTELWEITLSTHRLQRIAKLQLNGSAYELAASHELGGYLSCLYQNRFGQTQGILLHWQYPLLPVQPA